MKSIIQQIHKNKFIVFSLLGLLTLSCSLVKLKRDLIKIQETDPTIIVGNIYGDNPQDGLIIVAACSITPDKKIENYSVLHDYGEYEIIVGRGKYFVFAFWDKNRNLIYDKGEPAGQYGNPKVVQTLDAGVNYDIDIIIHKELGKIALPLGKKISSVIPQKCYSRQAGVITDLNDERFLEEHGKQGFWEPGSFISQFGATIYFLTEYDPDKLPILFIHGATGTPKSWSYFVNYLDTTRFQPWFFYYPSGLRIESMAYQLLWKLTNLHTKYQFNKIYITAHSMGGLVARSFIVNFSHQFPYVKLFVSIATPWGGNRMAELGVKKSPTVMPSWIDMQPEGDFVRSLYRKKLPEYIRFFMFYGYRGNRSLFRSNNDGTINLSSILDIRSQSEAEMNYAFDEDHSSILSSSEVMARYTTILNTVDEENNGVKKQTGGYLKVTISYDYDFKGVKPKAVLILHHEDVKDKKFVTFLDDEDDGKIVGPFPTGDYKAHLVTMAAKTKKRYLPVSIQSNKTNILDFIFEPDGVISGALTTTFNPEDKFPGRPDYRYRSKDEEIHIQSISLRSNGNGIHRKLQSVKGPDIYDYNHFIQRKDICYNNYYIFFGLPAGDYKLIIKAEGYRQINKKISVTPGEPKYFKVTELVPE